MAMRVLIVSAWDPVSGVRTVYRSLARHLASKDVSYDAYAFDRWGESTSWRDFCRRLYDSRDGTLTEVLVENHYDVVHCIDGVYSPPFGVDVWLSRARFRGGVVLMSQNSRPYLTERPTHPHVYIACSVASRAVMARTVTSPIRIIENAVELDRFRVVDLEQPRRPIILWVGRSTDAYQKNPELFLDLIRVLPEYDAEIVDLDDNAALLSGLSPSQRRHVRYRSRLSSEDLVLAYNRVRLSGGAVVNTSHFEGLPLSLLEAAACGAAVVAPTSPGMEYLSDSSAFLYDPDDGLRGLVQAVRRSSERALRDVVTANALRDVSIRHSAESMASAYFEAYADAELAAAQTARRRADVLVRWGWVVALKARRLVRELR